jgi:hypothetical protein
MKGCKLIDVVAHLNHSNHICASVHSIIECAREAMRNLGKKRTFASYSQSESPTRKVAVGWHLRPFPRNDRSNNATSTLL